MQKSKPKITYGVLKQNQAIQDNQSAPQQVSAPTGQNEQMAQQQFSYSQQIASLPQQTSQQYNQFNQNVSQSNPNYHQLPNIPIQPQIINQANQNEQQAFYQGQSQGQAVYQEQPNNQAVFSNNNINNYGKSSPIQFANTQPQQVIMNNNIHNQIAPQQFLTQAVNLNQVQKVNQQNVQLNNNINNAVEETRIYNSQVANSALKVFKNTELEEYELALSRKNKTEAAFHFKQHIDSLNLSIQENQPCIFDMQKSIEKTKLFCEKHKHFAYKLKDSMENLFKYDSTTSHQNKIDICYEKFSQENQIPNIGVINNNLVLQQLTQFTNQQLQIQLPINIELIQQEIQFLMQINSFANSIHEINSRRVRESIQIRVSSLSLYSQFIYHFIIMQKLFHIVIDFQDYYLFESTSEQQNGIQPVNFVALLLYALKCEQRLVYLLKENDANDEFLDFEAISRYFSLSPQLPIINMQIYAGTQLDSNKRPIDKYKELLLLYEKGCKSQIFKLLVEGKWPESLFQKSFDDSFNAVGQFQIWLIWMKQMQAKIIDFQLFIRARIKQGSNDQIYKEFSQNFTSKMKQFQIDVENSMFIQQAGSLYCVAMNIQSKDRMNVKQPINSIFYQIHDQSQIMLGHIVCQKTATSLCFFFKDKHENHSVKKVTAVISYSQQIPTIPSQRGQVAQIGARCECDFNINLAIDKTFNFQLYDINKLNEKYNQSGKFYDTLLINRLIERTRKTNPNELQFSFNLEDLLY